MKLRRFILILGMAASFAMIEATPASANIFKDAGRFVKKTTKAAERTAQTGAKKVRGVVRRTGRGFGLMGKDIGRAGEKWRKACFKKGRCT